MSDAISPGPVSTDLALPASALVIAAHPDDAEFTCGATLAKWARQGTIVHHLVLTDGSKGTWDRHVDQAELIERRQGEQRAAAAALGATGEVRFLGEVDGEVGVGHDLRGRVAAVLRELRPAVVLGHDPWKRYRLHPDHHAAGRLCIDGIVAARDPFFHPELLAEGLEPHRPDALLLFEADVVNHLESVTDVDLTAKVDALLEHRSQLETTHFHRVAGAADLVAEFRNRERRLLEESAAAFGGVSSGGVSSSGTSTGAATALAEGYHLIVDQL